MKTMSIRTKMLTGVVLLNLVGAILVIVYLHISFSGGLDVWAQQSLGVGKASWAEIHKIAGMQMGDPLEPKSAAAHVAALKAISGADYGLLLDKGVLNEQAWAKSRQAAGLPNNWDERDNYVLAASTNQRLSDSMQLKTTTADAVPAAGRVVGIENGSCTALCHRTVRGTGDFWKVSWSFDNHSRAHVVFPVVDKGKAVGVVYSIQDVTSQAENAKSVIYRTMSAIGLTLVVVTLVIGAMLDLWVFKPLNHMISSMEELSMRVVGGDFYAKYKPSGNLDEIGQFERFFERFLDLMTATLRSLVDK